MTQHQNEFMCPPQCFQQYRLPSITELPLSSNTRSFLLTLTLTSFSMEKSIQRPIKLTEATRQLCGTEKSTSPTKQSQHEAKQPFFFYGSLQDPTILKHVLTLKEQPILRPATVHGFRLKLWGPYPALLDGESDAMIPGMIYEINSSQQIEQLQTYETNLYTPN